MNSGHFLGLSTTVRLGSGSDDQRRSQHCQTACGSWSSPLHHPWVHNHSSSWHIFNHFSDSLLCTPCWEYLAPTWHPVLPLILTYLELTMSLQIVCKMFSPWSINCKGIVLLRSATTNSTNMPNTRGDLPSNGPQIKLGLGIIFRLRACGINQLKRFNWMMRLRGQWERNYSDQCAMNCWALALWLMSLTSDLRCLWIAKSKQDEILNTILHELNDNWNRTAAWRITQQSTTNHQNSH